MRLGPSIWDWLFGVVSVILALCALVVLLGGERIGIAVFVLFSGCTATAASTIVRKRRIRARASMPPVPVRGFAPFRAQRSHLMIWTAGVGVVGITIWATGSAGGTVFVWAGAGLAILGAVLSVLLALGVSAHGYLQFEPAGLRLGQERYSFLLEWDNVVDLSPGEYHGNDVLRINVRDLDRLRATLEPISNDARLAKAIRSSRQWFEADITLIAMHYGTDIGVLAPAITRYMTDPDARGELAR